MKASKEHAAQAAPKAGSQPAAPAQPTLARRLGNAGLFRMLQAKLIVGDPQDHFEQEADRVADQVMRMPEQAAGSASPPAPAQTATVQRAADASSALPVVDTALEEAVAALDGRGGPLSPEIRSFMEPRFGADLSAVRIHTDTYAHDLARSVNARAFAAGRNVVFGAGYYAPHTDSGRRLLAHELTHTLQQGASTRLAREVKRKKTLREQLPPHTPLVLSAASPFLLAQRAAGELKKQNGGTGVAANSRFLVAADALYVYSADFKLLKKIALKKTPPLVGVFVGDPAQGRSRFVNMQGRVHLVKDDNWGKGEWVTNWADVTANDLRTLVDSNFYIVVIGHVASPSAKSDKPGDGSGGGGGKQNAQAPRSAPASKSKQKGEGKEPIVRSFPGDAYTGQRSDQVANHGAFPSSIKLSSSLLPAGGASDATMRLVWQYYETDPVMAVWNASTRVTYRWERWNVTEAVAKSSREEVEKALRQTAFDAAARVDDEYSDYDKQRRIAEYEEQTEHSQEVIEQGGTAGRADDETDAEVLEERINRRLRGASAAVSTAGHVVDGVWHRITRPDHGITLTWPDQGTHLIRCIASPWEHGGRRYESSVATAFVEVRPREYIARNTLGAAEQSLVQLRIQRELATDPKEIQRLDGLIADVTTSAYGPVVDALGLVIARKQADLKTARGAEREKLEKELKELEKQLKQAKWNEEGYVGRDGKPGHAFRPQAAFVSDTSGTTFPLLLQLLPAPEDGVNQWVLRDVTTAGDKLGKGYFGRGATNRDAIVGAFHLFAHDNAYGFGTLMVRLPDSIPDARPTEIVLRNYPAAAQLAKERLADLATMFMVAGVAAPAIGQVGMYLGATLSAENILNRWRSGKLEPDLTFINDLLQVLGALATGASRIAALKLVPAGETFALAQVSGDIKAIEKALATVKRTELAARVAEKANDLATWGGVAVADYQLIERLKAIGEAERNGTMTHSEAGAQRGKAILGALQSKAMLFTGLLHKPVGIVEGPPVTTGSVPKPTEPATREPRPSHGDEGAANERTVLGRVFGRGAKPPQGPKAPEQMPAPWLREGPDSPERLFERLAQGPDPNTRIPPVPPGRRPVSEETLFSSGIKHPDDAYRAYNNALAVAGGREVAIWYRTDTGEYAVKIGTFGAVKAPDAVKPWIAIVHFHPNEHRSLTLRLPAPKSDFASLWERARFEHGVVREIVEWDMPDGSRGRTEYGIDLSHPNEPLYIRTSQPDGTLGPPQRFSEKGYAEHHAARTHFIEKGSPLHQELVLQKGDKQPPEASRRTAMPPASGGGGGGGDGDGPRSRQTSITAPYPTIKRLGPFTYTSQEASDGKTADWRVWNWARVGGPSKIANRDAQQFLEQLVAQARAAGNDMLVLTIENIEAPSVQRLSRPDSPMAKHLGVTAVERVDDRTIRWVIPLRGTPGADGAAGGSGSGGAPRAMIVPHDSPETKTVVGGIGREPSRTSVEPKDRVVVGGFGREPGRTPEAARDAVVVGGLGREPGRTPELAVDPVAIGGFGRDPSRPPDVPEHLSPSDGVPVSIDESGDTTGSRTNPVPRPGSEGNTPPGTTPRRDAVPEHIDDDGPSVHRIAPPRSGSSTGTGGQGRSPRTAADTPAGSTPPRTPTSRSPESSGGSGSTASRSTPSGSTLSASTPLRSTVVTGSATRSGTTTSQVSGRSPADPLASTPLESPTPPDRSPGAPDPFAPTPQESSTQVQTGTPTQVDPTNLFSARRGGEAERLAPSVERVNIDQWVHPIQKIGEGINTKYLLVDAVTGERWLFKPALGEEGMLFGPELGIRTGERWRRALAAAYLAQDLGLNTPYVRLIEIGGMVGSLQEWRQGYAARPRIRNQAQADFDRFWNSRFRHDIDAFDYFIANQDRHQGNVMIRMEGDRPSAMVIDQDAGIPASAERFSRQPPPSGRRLESWQRDLPPSVSRELAERFRDQAARFPDAELRKWLTGKEVDGLWSRLNEVVDALDDGRVGIIEESPTRAAGTAQPVSGSRRTAGNAAGGAFSTNAATQSATGTFSTNAATQDAVSGSVSTDAATVDASTTTGRSGSGSPTPSESPTPSRSPGSTTTTATGNDPSPGSSARTTQGPGDSSGLSGEAPLPKAAAIVVPGPEPSAGSRSNVQVSAADAITIDKDVERPTAQGPRQTSLGASASGQAVTVDVRTGGPGRQTTGAMTVTGQDIGVEVGRQKQGKGGPTAGIKLDSQGNPAVEAGWTFQTKGGSSIKPTFSRGTRVDAREPVQLEDGRFLVAYTMTETTTAGAGGAARRTPQGRPGFSAGGHFSLFEAESKQGTRIFKTKLEAEAFRNNAAVQLAFEQANAVPASSGEAAKIAVGETRGEADTKGSSAGLSGSFGGTTLGRNWQTSETTGRSFYRVSEDLLNVTTTVTRDKAKDWGIGAMILANQKGGDTTTGFGVTFQFNISTPAGREALDLYLKTGYPPLSGARLVSVMDVTGEGSYDRYQMPTLGTAAWSDRAWQKVTRGEEGATKEFGGEQVHQQDPTWLAELTGDRELYSSAQLISQQIRGKEQYTAIINIKSESGTYNREQFGKIFMGVKATGPVEQSGAWTLTAEIDKKVVHELERVSTKFKDAKNRDDKQRILSEVFRKTGAGMAGGLVRSGGGFMLSWDLELKGDPNFPGPAGRHKLVMQREELAKKLKTSPEAAGQVVRESEQVLNQLAARRKAVSDEKKYTDLPDELRKQQVALIDRHRYEFDQLRSNALMAAGKRDPNESIHAIRARLKKRDAYKQLEPEKRDVARLQDMVADRDAAVNELRQEIIIATEAVRKTRFQKDIPAKFKKHYLPYKAAMKEADQFHGEQAKLGPRIQELRDKAVQSLAAANPQVQTEAWRELEAMVSSRVRLLTLELNRIKDAGAELVPMTTPESRWGARYDEFWAPIEEVADEEPEEEFVPIAASMTLEERTKPRRRRR